MANKILKRRALALDRRQALAGGAAAAWLARSSSAQAQGVSPAIQAAAAKERRLTLMVLNSANDETIAGMIKAFRRRYPFLEITYTLQSTSQMMNRFTAEQATKRGVSDWVMLPSNIAETDKYVASGAVAKYVISQDAAYPGGTRQSGIWYAVGTERATTVYRKGSLSDEEKKLIRTFKGLGDPRFKGRLGINGITTSVTVTGAYVLLNQPDKSLWHNLAANRPRVKNASPALMDGLLAGEYDVSIFASYATTATAAKSGVPVEFGNTALVPTIYVPSGVSSLAPHPNAARLWQDWILSKEGQDLWVSLIGVSSARRDGAKPWAKAQPWFFDTPGSHKPIDWTDFSRKQADVVAQFQKDFQGS